MKILQSHLPFKPWASPRTRNLPGVQPIGAADWLLMDEVYAQQLALVDELLATRRDHVFGCAPEADEAAAELLDCILDWTGQQPGFTRAGDVVTRPDGTPVQIGADHPLVVARRLVQEDLLLHLKGETEHWLAAGALVFPASWTLHEKLGNGLVRVHRPVDHYTDDIAARVQRLFNGLQVGRPLMRANYLTYEKPDLHHPASEQARRDRSRTPQYLRMERQCLMRLPRTAAVVFTVHTFVLPFSKVPADDLNMILADESLDRL